MCGHRARGVARGWVGALAVAFAGLSACESRTLQAYPDQLAGVGIVVKTGPTGHVVSRVIEGGPAADAGVRPGDRIVAVDGATTDGQSLARVVESLRGEEGSEVVLRLAGGRGDVVVTVTRRLLARAGDDYRAQ
jgi:C-terminal processing protease CtpA/Prc